VPEIVFPVSSAPGPRPQESGGRLINAFGEAAPQGAPSKIVWRRTPGLLRLGDTLTHGHTRGFLDAGTLLWVLDNRIYAVDSAFTMTDLGALLGTLPVTMARNNNASPQNVAVTENGCFNVFTGSAPTGFADPDLPASPTSVSFLNGYFLWTYGDGRIFASDLNSVSVATNSFHVEQGLFIRRGFTYAGRFYAFGNKWTTVFRDAGTSPFPLAREVVIPRGIIGTFAIAGGDVGWANVPIFAGDDGIVYRLDGYTPVPISTDDVSRSIREAFVAGEDHLLEASVHMYGGHAMWTLTSPDRWTWEYNLTTRSWHEKISYGREDWRGRASIRIFDRWLVGDATTGRLFEMSGDYFLEDVNALIWRVDSGSVSDFPNGVAVSRASFNMTAGVGAYPTIGDPKVLIAWSLDGGHTFGTPLVRRMGGPGESKWYPSILSLGLSRGQGLRFRLTVSDAVHVALHGGVVDGEARGP
jgi:hypothetical protein